MTSVITAISQPTLGFITDQWIKQTVETVEKVPF